MLDFLQWILSTLMAVPKAIAASAESAVYVSMLSGLATAVARLVWSVSTWLLQAGRFYLSCRTTKHKMNFGPFKGVPKTIKGVYCQIIRYGTDQYIEKMASDQERYEGRLQNRVYKLKSRRDCRGQYIVRLALPVHKRLGTQFKLFVRLKDPSKADDVVKFLTDTQLLSQVHVSQYHSPPKISFLVDRFSTVNTVEGLTNNFYYPI
jgi:hypothetical protein